MRKFTNRVKTIVSIIGLGVVGAGLVLASSESLAAKSSERLNSLYQPAGNAIAGNPQGHVTVVEFFDYNCGYCRLMYPKVNEMIEQNKNIRVIFREYPVLSPRSVLPAKAALAAQKQGKYEVLHDAMMTAKMPLDQDEIVKLAKGVNINTDKLLKDMESSAVSQQLDANLQVGQSMNIQGVPTFVVVRTTPPSKQAGQVVLGPSMSELEDLIKKVENG